MENYCSECKGYITPKEYRYSMKKFGKVLCRDHQKKFSNFDKMDKNSEKKENIENNGKGLSKKESETKYNLVKGRIAETLIEELFLSLGYSVFRYGMENTVPGVMKLLKGVRSDVAQNIRRMPDFVIQDKNGEVYFIEVKFRASEEFEFKNLPKDYPYKNCYFIVVSKKHIKCITYQELSEGKKIAPKSKNYLGSRKEFELDKQVIIDFCGFAVKFFENV